MIKLPETIELFAPASALPDVRHTLWGLDARALHDAFWAAKGIRVVRRGAKIAPPETGPYLCLEPGDLVLMSPSRITDELRRSRALGLTVRLICHDDEHYGESIVADAGGGFCRVERRYQPRTHRASWGVITAEPALARAWAAAPRLSDALRAVRAIADTARLHRAAERARLWDDAVAAQRTHFMAILLERWRGAPRVIPGTVEVRPGVVAHRTAMISPGAFVIGPVWIGANVQVPAEAAIVGPHIEPDAPLVTKPRHAPPAHTRSSALGRVTRRRRPGDVVKRGLDITISLLALFVTAPLFPIVLALIYLEDGRPFFFVHKRQSLGGREFGCLKFRTMFNDAEARKPRLAKENLGPQFFMRNDPRVLRIGRLLRDLQLDELPQFVNVLRGEMSVVGPRPSPDAENQCCPAWREARLSVRPGITGLWQVRRTREPQIDFQEWIRYDLEYVRTRSLWLDLKIIAATAILILRGVLTRNPPAPQGKFQ